jgi:putative FmdB family regulatory protein
MPIYEYRCNNCRKKVSVFMRMVNLQGQPACPECQGTDMTRVFSSFAMHRSIQSIHEDNSNPGSGDYYKDPRNIGRQLEDRFKGMNMEVPPEIRQSIDSAREGVLPESLKDLDSASSDAAYH